MCDLLLAKLGKEHCSVGQDCCLLRLFGTVAHITQDGDKGIRISSSQALSYMNEAVTAECHNTTRSLDTPLYYRLNGCEALTNDKVYVWTEPIGDVRKPIDGAKTTTHPTMAKESL